MKFYIALMTIIFIPSLCSSASFNCSNASSTIEKTICSHAELSTEDENLSSAYKDALKKASDKKLLISQQKEWLRSRKTVSAPEGLLAMYRNRTIEINKQEIPKKYSIGDFNCTSWEPRKQLSTGQNRLAPEIYYEKCSDKALNKIIKVSDVILYPNMSVEDPDIQVALSKDSDKLIFALTTVWEKNLWVINIKNHTKELFTDIFPGRELEINWTERNKFSLTYCSPGVCEEYDYIFTQNRWKLNKTEFVEEGDEGK